MSSANLVKPLTWVECPRDAMQGIEEFIPTETKIRYLNTLLQVGFHTLDFGSFVSPKAIPQMRDTRAVLDGLKPELLNHPKATRLLAIVANERGAREASELDQIQYLGYPFSISESFQRRNTGADMEESWNRLMTIRDICTAYDKTPVVYLSMAFGNPYGDEWSTEICLDWAGKLAGEGFPVLALADTLGSADERSVRDLFGALIPTLPQVEFGAHFHATPERGMSKISWAWEAGCRRFDTAMKGFGGCPMAADHLTGNISSEILLEYVKQRGMDPGLDHKAWQEAWNMTPLVMGV